MTNDAMPDALPRRTKQKSGYPGKAEFSAADARLRAALSRLARDPDPEARLIGAQIAAEATEVLHALATRATEATTAHKQARERVERMRKTLDERLAAAARRQRVPTAFPYRSQPAAESESADS